jgi:CRP-like cAMP-binding protein
MPENNSRGTITNRILSRLSPEDFRLLQPHLEPTKLPLGKALERRNRTIEHVYFIEHGLASVVADGTKGRTIEVGVIGWEGMTGLAVVLGTDRSPNETYMQLAGDALCMAAVNLRLRMQESASLHRTFMNYGHVFLIQAGQTALANGRGTIEERLARWLLMAHDRMDGDELPLTHEFLATMLGVRRPGVTVALKRLEKRGFIQTNRRAIEVIDREGLKKSSNGAYGVAEAEYRRIFA